MNWLDLYRCVYFGMEWFLLNIMWYKNDILIAYLVWLMDDDAVEEPDDDGDETADELADATNTRSSEGLDFALELDASSAVEK